MVGNEEGKARDEGEARDVATLDLKCGLEIHQQLDVGKLFCRCPCIIREGRPDFVLTRFLRASAGETGEVDLAAQHEQAKAKRYTYQGYHDTTCLVELDEEPPHSLNEAALHATLQTAKLLNAHILDEVHVMRKTVVDGSNTSGFQRTALVALGGKLVEEPVRIQTICLEEDACKIVERKAGADVYNLSRLGIPLVEIATEPDITSPEQARRVAAELGMILRSTGACKRGLGTIRQDVNVSIKGDARVEIKGVQDLKLLPQLVANEALRQRGLLTVKEELSKRGVKAIMPPPPKDVSKYFVKHAKGFVKKGVEQGLVLVGIPLPNFTGLFATELFTNYRLGTELAGYAKAFGYGGIIHSDEALEKYGFTTTSVAEARKALGCKKEDAFILVLGEKEAVAEFYAFSLIPRLEHLLRGVPSEVRKANADATSQYLRPMPGAARMYPETDIPRVRTNAASVEKPKLLREQEAELVKKYKLGQGHARELLREGWPFSEYVNAYAKLTPTFIATTLLDTPKELKKRYGKEVDLTAHEETLKTILAKVNAGVVPREAVIQLFAGIADGHAPDFTTFQSVDKEEVERVVKVVIKADPGAPLNALMGAAMAKLRGKASGKEVMALLQQHAAQKGGKGARQGG